MALLTPTEVSVEDVPLTDYGTATTRNLKRRCKIFLRFGTVTNADTCRPGDYVPNLNDVEGCLYYTADSNVSSTALTWSGTTVTLAAKCLSTCEVGILANFI